MGQVWSTEENEAQPRSDSLLGQNLSVSRMANENTQPKKLRNARVTILKEILKMKIKLDEDLEKENNSILKEFLDSFIQEMKEKDPIFKSLFQRIVYTGSYYSDLRISKPDEYDLNLVLKLPKLQEVSYISQVPSYVKYRISDENVIKQNGLSKLFEDEFLIPSKVRIWMQSVVDKALKTYKPPPRISRITPSASGPAKTMILMKRNGGVIDIDFVPAIECALQQKPPGIDGRVYDRVKNNLKCFLVPKPYQTSRQAPINDKECVRLWRAHYPDAESSIIYNLGCVKPIIKLLKLLRDKEDWKIIASYYLKTVLMWMILEHPNKEYWTEDKMGDRFYDALVELAKCVQARKIRYFFSSRYNLLEKLSEAQAFNINNRLCSIIKDIDKDYQNLWRIFNCNPTFSM